ncbi:MAG: DEAD/DEAH box helicase [Methanobacteriota archaeon]
MDVFDMLNESVKVAIRVLGLNKPTKPQELALPMVLSGKNVLLIAPTGTGKTEAALLPVSSLHLSKKPEPGIKILYIAPLRALNRDMLARLECLGKNLGIRIEVRHGDTPTSQRQRQTKNPPDMLITTPETLQAILPGKIIGKHLRSVRWVVVDEIHELAEDKRGVQLSVGLERLSQIAGEFQRIGLSATVGSKDEIAKFLAGSGRQIEVLDASMEKETEVKVESPMPTKDDTDLAERLYVDPTMAARLRKLHDLFSKHSSVLVFVNTRETAEILGSRLKLLDPSLKIGIHHGSLARDIRVEAEDDFRSGRIKGLICTSSMELGIDIGAVELVVQYMSPRQVTRLVQRVGRSGHRVGALSKGVVISSSPDDIAEATVIARKTMRGELEAGRFHELASDVLAHQLAGISLGKGRIGLDEALSLLRRAQPYRDLDRETVESILGQLQSQGLIWLENGWFKLRRPGLLYYFTNLSMIPNTRRYTIRDLASRKNVGSLDEEFVAYHGEQGAVFIMKGEAWRIIDVDHEREQVLVEPINDPLGAIPAWEGELIPVPFEVAQEVGALRARAANLLIGDRPNEAAVNDIVSDYPVTEAAASWFIDQIREQLNNGVLPTNELLLMETSGSFSVLHACFGSLVNQTIAWVVAALLSARIGASVAIKVDPYRIVFRFPGEAKPELIEKIIIDLKAEHLQSVLQLTIKDSSIFKWRLVQVAKRFGAIKRDAELAKINLRRVVRSFEGTPIYDEAMRETMVEKLDVMKTEEILKSLSSGKIKISTSARDKEGPTPLAWPALDELAGSELVIPKRAEREILRALIRRLDQQQVRLYCMNYNSWSVSTRVGRVQDPPSCKNCGARLITLLPRENREFISAIKKRASGKKLTIEEDRMVKRAFQAANLLLTYGKRAVVALSGRGIGPQIATRILANNPQDDDFYRAILQAEKTYSRTRRFWANP